MANQDLFTSPSLQTMMSLSDPDFLDFVQYVFTRAGFEIEPDNRGIIVLNYLRKFFAYVHVVHNKAQRVSQADVMRVGGPDGPAKKTYIISTTGYHPEAESLAVSNAAYRKYLKLVTPAQFLRYIKYIDGTRFEGSNAPAISPDPLFAADEAAKVINTRKPHVLMVANNKGGVGKTTTALNLCYGIAQRGKTVLAVDFDPQANLTTALLTSNPPVPVSKHLGHYFANRNPLNTLVRSSQFEKIYVIPAHEEMRLTYADMADWPDLQIKFAQDLLNPTVVNNPSVEYGEIDWIIIDTPPDLGLQTRSAMCAAHYVLAPVIVSINGTNGVRNLMHTIEAMHELMGIEKHTELIGCVVSRWKDSVNSREERQAFLEVLDGDNVARCATIIPEDIGVSKAYLEITRPAKTKSKGLFENEGNKITKAYKELISEVFNHVGDN